MGGLAPDGWMTIEDDVGRERRGVADGRRDADRSNEHLTRKTSFARKEFSMLWRFLSAPTIDDWPVGVAGGTLNLSKSDAAKIDRTQSVARNALKQIHIHDPARRVPHLGRSGRALGHSPKAKAAFTPSRPHA